MTLRLLVGSAMAAHAKRRTRELGQAVPAPLPVIRPAEREAGLDALLESPGAGRIVAAEAYTPQPDARGVEIAARHHVIDHGLHRDLVVAADRKIVLALTLPRPVEHQGCDAAIEIGPLIGVGFLFRGVETDSHDQHR